MMRKITALFIIFSVLFVVSGCAGKANPWLNEGEYYQTKQKLEFDKKAVIRYQQAEASAVKDGDEESAAAYRAAREGLQAAIPQLEERFNVLEAERQERLKNQQEHFMTDD